MPPDRRPRPLRSGAESVAGTGTVAAAAAAAAAAAGSSSVAAAAAVVVATVAAAGGTATQKTTTSQDVKTEVNGRVRDRRAVAFYLLPQYQLNIWGKVLKLGIVLQVDFYMVHHFSKKKKKKCARIFPDKVPIWVGGTTVGVKVRRTRLYPRKSFVMSTTIIYM